MIDKHFRAARAILHWKREDLAEAAGVSLSTIQTLEEGGSSTQKTIDKVKRALERNGIQFHESGVTFPDTSFVKLEGDAWFVEVLDDVYHTLKTSRNKELLVFGCDDRVSPPAVVEGFQKLVGIGVTIREMVEEGNDYIMGDVENYRWIPKTYFKNYVTVIYGDKVVNDFGSYGVMFRNPEWAAARRNEFEYAWSRENPLKIKSSADVRYKV